MTAYNVVRFRVKPGREKDFHDKNREQDWVAMKGFRKLAFIDTGERNICMVAEWDSMDSIVAARSTMIGMLGDVRDMLEDLGGDLGVTDPVSGEAVVEIG